MADQIYASTGAVAMTVGFTLLAISVGDKNYTLAYALIAFIIIGLIMIFLAYMGARKRDDIERKIKLIEYNNALTTIKELEKANENIANLINEIRQERNERNNRDKK